MPDGSRATSWQSYVEAILEPGMYASVVEMLASAHIHTLTTRAPNRRRVVHCRQRQSHRVGLLRGRPLHCPRHHPAGSGPATRRHRRGTSGTPRQTEQSAPASDDAAPPPLPPAPAPATPPPAALDDAAPPPLLEPSQPAPQATGKAAPPSPGSAILSTPVGPHARARRAAEALAARWNAQVVGISMRPSPAPWRARRASTVLHKANIDSDTIRASGTAGQRVADALTALAAAAPPLTAPFPPPPTHARHIAPRQQDGPRVRLGTWPCTTRPASRPHAHGPLRACGLGAPPPPVAPRPPCPFAQATGPLERPAAHLPRVPLPGKGATMVHDRQRLAPHVDARVGDRRAAEHRRRRRRELPRLEARRRPSRRDWRAVCACARRLTVLDRTRLAVVEATARRLGLPPALFAVVELYRNMVRFLWIQGGPAPYAIRTKPMDRAIGSHRGAPSPPSSPTSHAWYGPPTCASHDGRPSASSRTSAIGSSAPGTPRSLADAAERTATVHALCLPRDGASTQEHRHGLTLARGQALPAPLHRRAPQRRAQPPHHGCRRGWHALGPGHRRWRAGRTGRPTE